MKRYTALFLIAFSGLALADNTQYRNEAGQPDLFGTPVADKGDWSVEEPSYPQVG